MEIRTHALHLRVDLKRQPFLPPEVWKGAIRSYVSKANSLTHQVTFKQRRAEARGLQLNLDPENALLTPLGSIDETGVINWIPEFNLHCKECDES